MARAYLELSRLGLIDSQVGRGTFVSSKAKATDQSWQYNRVALKAPGDGSKRVDWSGRYSRYVDGLGGLVNRLPQFGDEAISFAGGIPRTRLLSEHRI